MKSSASIRDIWLFRSVERRLFLASFITIGLGYVAFFLSDLQQSRELAYRGWLPLVVFGISLVMIHGWFVITRFKGDPIILGAVVFLGGFGILAQYRMGLFDFENPWRLSHFAYPIGVMLMLLVVGLFKNGRYQVLRSLGWTGAILSLLLLVGLMTAGTRYRGAYYASGQLTPSEIIKLLMVLFIASFFASKEKEIRKTLRGGKESMISILWPVAVVYLLLFGLLIFQRDLGMLAILTLTLFMLLFFITGHWRYLVLSGSGLLIAGYLVNHFILHARQRIQTWFDPFTDPTGSGWQVLQGLSGMFAGGLFGAGFGKGNPERIPIAESDFMYAVIGEELGFAGCMLVVLFYLIFFHQGFRIAHHTKDYFGSLLAAGVVSTLACQTLLNIGGVTKSIPLTGVPLPLISHGGSSLVTVFLGLGLLLSISENRGKGISVPAKPSKTRVVNTRSKANTTGSAKQNKSQSRRRTQKGN
ncbi:MAG: FtsW/RodA/SpoVE family cell cycle protein [Verrucomicrobiota bacterium]|nr:FtsW/RodA/SpoVE family cell cycle protein [Verrucomicrobiota bacterium]